MSEITILTLVGSLRTASVNRQLAELATQLAPPRVHVELYEGLENLPFYNEDLDTPEPPPAVAALRVAAAAADATLVVTPEYNGTIPGVLKNAIDWLSRPFGASALQGKPLAVIGAALGRYGGAWAHDETRKSFVAGAGSPLPAGGWLGFNPATGTFSGTPVAANRADYELQLKAVNPLGTTVVSNTFRITVGGGGLDAAYAAWAAGKFPPVDLGNPALEATLWGQDDDPDQDGNTNLLEMLFGLNPNLADHPQLVFTRISSIQSTLNFPLSTVFPADQVKVEWSTDLAVWSRTGVSITPDPTVTVIPRVTALITSPVPRTRIYVRVVAGE